MSPSVTPARPSRASLERSGAVITAVFALAWAFTGTVAVPADAVAVGAGSGALVVTAAAVVAAVTSAPRRRSGLAAEADLPADWRHQFNVIGAVQGAAIALAVLVGIVAGVEGLIPAAVCLIVGLHFLPVARVLQLRYRPIGAALCVVAAAGAVVHVTAGRDWSMMLVGAGAALTLWSASFRHTLTGLATEGPDTAGRR
jgi:hypothetical protein